MMVKLTSIYGWEVPQALREGRTQDAKRIASEYLRMIAGNPDVATRMIPEFFDIVAEMLFPSEKRSRGAPRKSEPPFWYSIGSDFDEMKRQGLKRNDIISALSAKYGPSLRKIEDTLAYYNKMMDDYGEAFQVPE